MLCGVRACMCLRWGEHSCASLYGCVRVSYDWRRSAVQRLSRLWKSLPRWQHVHGRFLWYAFSLMLDHACPIDWFFAVDMMHVRPMIENVRGQYSSNNCRDVGMQCVLWKGRFMNLLFVGQASPTSLAPVFYFVPILIRYFRVDLQSASIPMERLLLYLVIMARVHTRVKMRKFLPLCSPFHVLPDAFRFSICLIACCALVLHFHVSFSGIT